MKNLLKCVYPYKRGFKFQISIFISSCALKFPFSIFVLLTTLTFSCTTPENKHASDSTTTYTCPMHPTVLKDKPGVCPVCGMELVLKGQPGQEVKITSELNYLLKPTNVMVIGSIQTVMPVEKTMPITSMASGIITYDTRRLTSIPIRFGGRIESLSVRYNFQPIRKGQKILEIYSPELLTAQRDLLYLVKSDKDNTALVDGSKERLRLLGISDSQIEKLISTGTEIHSFPVYSPVDGYIVEEKTPATFTPTTAAKTPGTDMDGGMGAGPAQNSIPAARSEILMREGVYVNTGQAIFNVVNTSQVWAEFKVPQQDGSLIKTNDRVQISLDNTADSIEAKVNFIQPFIKNGESFSILRVYLPNPGGKIKVGQLARATFKHTAAKSMWIPSSARLELGVLEIVFEKRRGVFRPKAIQTSRRSGEWIEVTGGIEANDSIAYNAQFMVDSESFIKIRN